MVIEKCPMVNEDTDVYLIGFNDPYSDAHDFVHRCTLKDSMATMDTRLEEVDFGKDEIRYYQFSVLLVDEEKNHRLVYSYNADKDIHISKGFEGAVIFDDGREQPLPTKEWLPYPGGRLVIRTIENENSAEE